jgi:hypothetical protein
VKEGWESKFLFSGTSKNTYKNGDINFGVALEN